MHRTGKTLSQASASCPVQQLGSPCWTTAVKDAVLGTRAGKPVIWLVAEGSAIDPSWLVAVDVATARVEECLAIDKMTGPKAVCQTDDGIVYVGGYHSGALFRYRPGTGTVDDLGLPFPTTEFLFALHPGARPGEVLGGTWPEGAAFRWTEEDGFAALGPVPIQPEAQWLRCIATDPLTGAVILGSGTPQGWTVIGSRGGRLTLSDTEQTFGYQAIARDGIAVLVGTDDAQVVRLTDEPAVTELYRIADTAPQRPVLPRQAETDGRVILWHSDKSLCLHSPSGCRALDSQGATPASLMALDQETVIFAGADGITRVPSDGSRASFLPYSSPLPSTRQSVSAMAVGTDDRIYAGGFLNGGVGRFDPATKETTRLTSIGQPEVIGRWGDDLLIGAYPGAKVRLVAAEDLASDRLHAADGTADEISFHGQGQDRPYAFAAVDDRLAYCGFMADYGRLPGGLVRLHRDPSASRGHRLQADRVTSPVGDRSVIGLYRTPDELDGGVRVLWATTMVYGGMGIAPTEDQAILLRIDTDAEDLTLPLSPPVPARALYGGGFARGKFWMLADTRLFGIDVRDRSWTEVLLGSGIPSWGQPGRHAHQASVRVLDEDRLIVTLADVGIIMVDFHGPTSTVIWAGQARHPVLLRNDLYFVNAASLELCRIPLTSHQPDGRPGESS